jgi:hypothetical protein
MGLAQVVGERMSFDFVMTGVVTPVAGVEEVVAGETSG